MFRRGVNDLKPSNMTKYPKTHERLKEFFLRRQGLMEKSSRSTFENDKLLGTVQHTKNECLQKSNVGLKTFNLRLKGPS